MEQIMHSRVLHLPVGVLKMVGIKLSRAQGTNHKDLGFMIWDVGFIADAAFG